MELDYFCPVPLTVRGTQALVSFAPLAFKLFYAARQNAVLRRSPSQEAPHTDLQPRFDAAVDAFGADRLMWGSDFPFVQLNDGQKASLEAVRGFSRNLPKAAQDALLGGTARRLFRLP